MNSSCTPGGRGRRPAGEAHGMRGYLPGFAANAYQRWPRSRVSLLELRELVLQLPHLLLRQRALLLVVLELLLDGLDLLLALLRVHVRLLLSDHVTHRIKLHLLLHLKPLLLLVLARALALALLRKAPTLHDPLLLCNRTAELLVVRDDDHATLEIPDGERQGAQPVAVQVVRRLIQNQDVRVQPHARPEHDLDLLATGEGLDGGVRRSLHLKPEVDQVLLHTLRRQRLLLQPSHHRLLLVLALNLGEHAHLLKDAALNPDRILDGLVHELRLVLLGLLLLVLAAVQDRLRVDRLREVLLLLARLELVVGVQEVLLLVRDDDLSLEVDRLLVVAASEALQDVLHRRLGEVLLQVLEGVLRDVRHAQVRVALHLTLGRDELAREQLDSSGLARAVRTNHRDAAHTRRLEVNVEHRRRVARRVLERNLLHLDQVTALALDASKRARHREDELRHVVLQREVALLLRVAGYELGEHVALRAVLEGAELALLEVHERIAHDVQELSVMRGGDNRAATLHEVRKPAAEPRDVGDVQVPGRLVKHQKVRLHQLRRAELHLHLPPTGVRPHAHGSVRRAVLARPGLRVAEPDADHDLRDLVTRHLGRAPVNVVAHVNDPVDTLQVDVQDGETD